MPFRQFLRAPFENTLLDFVLTVYGDTLSWWRMYFSDKLFLTRFDISNDLKAVLQSNLKYIQEWLIHDTWVLLKKKMLGWRCVFNTMQKYVTAQILWQRIFVSPGRYQPWRARRIYMYSRTLQLICYVSITLAWDSWNEPETHRWPF